MKSSSANQQAFDFDDTAPSHAPSAGAVDADANELPQQTPSSASTTPKFPNFGESSDLYAVAARRAGRLNAAAVSDKEVEDLFDERQRLIDKELDGTITRSEELRLIYVRWSLDRIEDARYGHALDALENWIVQYEQFQRDVGNLHEELAKFKRGSRRERKQG